MTQNTIILSKQDDTILAKQFKEITTTDGVVALLEPEVTDATLSELVAMFI